MERKHTLFIRDDTFSKSSKIIYKHRERDVKKLYELYHLPRYNNFTNSIKSFVYTLNSHPLFTYISQFQISLSRKFLRKNKIRTRIFAKRTPSRNVL